MKDKKNKINNKKQQKNNNNKNKIIKMIKKWKLKMNKSLMILIK